MRTVTKELRDDGTTIALTSPIFTFFINEISCSPFSQIIQINNIYHHSKTKKNLNKGREFHWRYNIIKIQELKNLDEHIKMKISEGKRR